MTFAHLKHVKCLSNRDVPFDIGIVGAPFDTAVTYRPGRFPWEGGGSYVPFFRCEGSFFLPFLLDLCCESAEAFSVAGF